MDQYSSSSSSSSYVPPSKRQKYDEYDDGDEEQYLDDASTLRAASVMGMSTAKSEDGLEKHDGDMEEDEEEEEEVVVDFENMSEMNNFINQVKRMCELEDEIKEMNSNRKVLADEKNELRNEIMRFMNQNNVTEVNYGKNEVIRLETRETSGSLTRKSLLAAIKAYYELNNIELSKEKLQTLSDNVKERVEDAGELYEFINEYLGSQEKEVLVREAKSKKKRARKRPNPSIFDSTK